MSSRFEAMLSDGAAPNRNTACDDDGLRRVLGNAFANNITNSMILALFTSEFPCGGSDGVSTGGDTSSGFRDPFGGQLQLLTTLVFLIHLPTSTHPSAP